MVVDAPQSIANGPGRGSMKQRYQGLERQSTAPRYEPSEGREGSGDGDRGQAAGQAVRTGGETCRALVLRMSASARWQPRALPVDWWRQVTMLVMAVSWWLASPAHANPTYYNSFKATYQTSPLSDFSSTPPSMGCLVCHTSTSGGSATVNSYGNAFAAQSHTFNQALESSNSDGDGPTINVTTGSTGTGTVTSSPGGITCGITCSASFNSAVTLTAMPDPGSTFTGWSGGGTPACSGTGTCVVSSNNITEINLGTFPGNSASLPTINVTATFTESFNYLLAASGNITVTQGMSGSTTLTVTWTAGTAQSVSFTASGLPIGATAAFSPGACPPTPTCTSQLTITTTASTPTGMSQITVTGSPLSKTTMFNLNVIPPSPEFDYTLPKPNDITVTQGRQAVPRSRQA